MIITKSDPFPKDEIEKQKKKNNYIALSSLAMDLLRVAMGYHRGSKKMAERFFAEALKRKQEIDVTNIQPYLQVLLDKFPSIKSKNDKDIAEDALMYSTLFQNAAMKINRLSEHW